MTDNPYDPADEPRSSAADTLSDADPTNFVAALLAWFDRVAAPHPWRIAPDAYRVWLSEIMLQQTQIETVLPYYNRFLQSYPDVRALAAAPLDEVLKLWEGLGYYSRARRLHQTARLIAEERGGHFPDTAEGLQQLPGIGPYTAGAIASIAFNQAAPVLDGNVIRVFARLLDLPDDVTQHAVKKRLWAQAAQWVPHERPGAYNQALMELGQRVCTPRQPACDACPLQAHCRAYAAGTQHQRPVKAKRAAVPHADVAAGIIYGADGRVLIAQRPPEGLLAHLWEFPGGKREGDETLQDCLKRELREELAIEVEVGSLFRKLKHAFTHLRITLYAYECRYQGPMPPYDAPQTFGVQKWAWVTLAQLDDYSFGKVDRQIAQALQEQDQLLL